MFLFYCHALYCCCAAFWYLRCALSPALRSVARRSSLCVFTPFIVPPSVYLLPRAVSQAAIATSSATSVSFLGHTSGAVAFCESGAQLNRGLSEGVRSSFDRKLFFSFLFVAVVLLIFNTKICCMINVVKAGTYCFLFLIYLLLFFDFLLCQHFQRHLNNLIRWLIIRLGQPALILHSTFIFLSNITSSTASTARTASSTPLLNRFVLIGLR